jgi:hypothetical protein
MMFQKSPKVCTARIAIASHHSTEMTEKRELVVGRLKQLQSDCATILRLIEDVPLVKQLKTEKLFTPQHLQEKYEVSGGVMQGHFELNNVKGHSR